MKRRRQHLDAGPRRRAGAARASRGWRDRETGRRAGGRTPDSESQLPRRSTDPTTARRVAIGGEDAEPIGTGGHGAQLGALWPTSRALGQLPRRNRCRECPATARHTQAARLARASAQAPVPSACSRFARVMSPICVATFCVAVVSPPLPATAPPCPCSSVRSAGGSNRWPRDLRHRRRLLGHRRVDAGDHLGKARDLRADLVGRRGLLGQRARGRRASRDGSSIALVI